MKVTDLKFIYLSERELQNALTDYLAIAHGRDDLANHIRDNDVSMEWVMDSDTGDPFFVISADGEVDEPTPGTFHNEETILPLPDPQEESDVSKSWVDRGFRRAPTCMICILEELREHEADVSSIVETNHELAKKGIKTSSSETINRVLSTLKEAVKTATALCDMHDVCDIRRSANEH